MDEKIDLGVSTKERYGDLSGLSQPEQSPGADDTQYPSFHYSGPKELELPDEGCMTIHFRKRSETSSTRKDGKHWYECDIEVQEICDVEDDEPDSPTHRDTSAEDALDKLAEAITKRREA